MYRIDINLAVLHTMQDSPLPHLLVLPKEIVIADISVETVANEAELTLVEQLLVLDNEETNIAICIDYEGKGTVNGTIITPSGETFIMGEQDKIKQENDKKFIQLMYPFDYAEAGTYYVRVNHYPTETKIGLPYTEEQGANEKDIIVITQ